MENNEIKVGFLKKHRVAVSAIGAFIICYILSLKMFQMVSNAGLAGGYYAIFGLIVLAFILYGSSKLIYNFLKPIGITLEQEKTLKLEEKKDFSIILIAVVALFLINLYKIIISQ